MSRSPKFIFNKALWILVGVLTCSLLGLASGHAQSLTTRQVQEIGEIAKILEEKLKSDPKVSVDLALREVLSSFINSRSAVSVVSLPPTRLNQAVLFNLSGTWDPEISSRARQADASVLAASNYFEQLTALSRAAHDTPGAAFQLGQLLMAAPLDELALLVSRSHRVSFFSGLAQLRKDPAGHDLLVALASRIAADPGRKSDFFLDYFMEAFEGRSPFFDNPALTQSTVAMYTDALSLNLMSEEMSKSCALVIDLARETADEPGHPDRGQRKKLAAQIETALKANGLIEKIRVALRSEDCEKQLNRPGLVDELRLSAVASLRLAANDLEGRPKLRGADYGDVRVEAIDEYLQAERESRERALLIEQARRGRSSLRSGPLVGNGQGENRKPKTAMDWFAAQCDAGRLRSELRANDYFSQNGKWTTKLIVHFYRDQKGCSVGLSSSMQKRWQLVIRGNLENGDPFYFTSEHPSDLR